MELLSDTENSRVEKEILLDLLDDYVGVWEVASLIEDHQKKINNAQSVSAHLINKGTYLIIKELLMNGWVRAGVARNDGRFEPWTNVVPAEERIRESLDEIGRVPTLGDIAWLDLTPAGKTYAKGLDS